MLCDRLTEEERSAYYNILDIRVYGPSVLPLARAHISSIVDKKEKKIYTVFTIKIKKKKRRGRVRSYIYIHNILLTTIYIYINAR